MKNVSVFPGSHSGPSPLVTLANVLSQDVGRSAFDKVRSNHGAPGCDGVTIEELEPVFDAQWEILGHAIRAGVYCPRPLRRVEIPKADGGVRKLGIPSVMDRVLQQALTQAITPLFEPRFSPHSFAYRPGRCTIDAVKSLQETLRTNDSLSALHLDIRAFFDSVDHSLVRERLSGNPISPEVLDLVDGSIRSRVMENGLIRVPTVGIPQGSPLSPLIANIVLDLFDRWLGVRGHAFARYADDVMILVPSLAAGQRIIDEASTFLGSVRLDLNREKTKLSHWSRASFLGFSFRQDQSGRILRCVSEESLSACRAEIMQLTSPGAASPEPGESVGAFLAGWTAYYRFTEQSCDLTRTYAMARDRVREGRWHAWRTVEKRRRELLLLGVAPALVERASSVSAPPLALLREVMPDESFRRFRLTDPFIQRQSDPPPVNNTKAARPAYDGTLPGRSKKPGIQWRDSLIWTLRRVARSRLIRVRLETRRSPNGWLPRPSAIGVEIGSFCFRFRL